MWLTSYGTNSKTTHNEKNHSHSNSDRYPMTEHTFYVHKASAFDFLMLWHKDSGLTSDLLDEWVPRAIAAEIAKTPIDDFFQGLGEWAVVNIGESFVQDVLLRAIARYSTRQVEIEKAMERWLEDDSEGHRNFILLMASTSFVDVDIHVFLSRSPIPKPFSTPYGVKLHFIGSPI